MYRKFWLVNNLTKVNPSVYPKYELTDPDQKHFLSDPTGLGFTKNYEIEKIGNSEKVIKQEFNLTDITGDIVFYADTIEQQYQDYFEFIQYVKYQPLEFHQLPANTNVGYYTKVIFVQAEKDDVDDETGALHIKVTFHKLTEWLSEYTNELILTNDISDLNGKHYNLVRDYYYSGTLLDNVEIYNNGTSNIGFIVEIDGYIENPKFTITEKNSTEPYGICDIANAGSASETNPGYTYIKINSIEHEQDIYLERNGIPVNNPKQYRKLDSGTGEEYVTFCRLKVGKSYFNLTAGNIDTFNGTVTIKWSNSYATV